MFDWDPQRSGVRSPATGKGSTPLRLQFGALGNYGNARRRHHFIVVDESLLWGSVKATKCYCTFTVAASWMCSLMEVTVFLAERPAPMMVADVGSVPLPWLSRNRRGSSSDRVPSVRSKLFLRRRRKGAR